MPKPRGKAVWIVTVAMGLIAAAVTHGAEPPRPASAGTGTLEIAGKGVEKLVLSGPRLGQEQTLDRPGPKVSLPAGRYTVKQIVLEGSFEGLKGRRPVRPGSFPDIIPFTIVPGESYRLKIGTPLTSTVTVKRRGSVLRLDYEMFDAGGWEYSARGGRQDPPRVNIYRGDELVGSGTFEYG